MKFTESTANENKILMDYMRSGSRGLITPIERRKEFFFIH